MRPRSTASSQPPTWAIVALVTLAHLALAWGLVHGTAAPKPTTPPALSVQWVAEPTTQTTQTARATPDTRPKASPSALATTPTTAKAPPATQAPTALPAIAPVNTPAVATTPALTPANPTVAANSPPATVQPSPMAAPAPTPGPATAPNLPGTATPKGVAAGAPGNTIKNAPGGPATTPSFDAAYLHNPKPNYPTRSRQLGEAGTVVLKVRIEANGQASQVLLSKSSGHERLDTAALESVKRWRFVPAQEGNQAAAAWVFVPVPFGLE
jgi:protein TonB